MSSFPHLVSGLPLLPIGDNPTRIWGMTSRERLRRIAASQGRRILAERDDRPMLLIDLDYVFDPAWLRIAEAHPGHAITRDGVPVITHAIPGMEAATPLPAETIEVENAELRKRERPFVERLSPATVRLIEEKSYAGSYKGVTDILTKYLWPRWAFHLTRGCAAIGLSPNGVTVIGALFCLVATVCFFVGWFWTGLATGLVMMVLDTVDGKLARCTITSSRLGNILDHGMDLIHPPFWWYGWGVGLAAYGRPLADDIFWACMAAILGGYVAQRAIEGAFIALFDIHIHVWRRFDSWFRMITARRNPNMPILAAFLLLGRPDWGLVAVAIWTVASLAVHMVQLSQALLASARGRPVVSWLV